MASSPIVARWELSRRLAALRKDRGLDVKAITDHLGFTRNYWSAVENDRTVLAADKLELFFELVDISKEEQAELTELWEESRERGWWDEHVVLGDGAKQLCGFEAGAKIIQAYESHYVPGLLQTEAYARAIIESDPRYSPVEHHQLIEARLRRQLILSAGDPPHFQVLLSEAVLHQQYAGAEVQARQLNYIADRMEEAEHIEVRVIPFDVNPGIIGQASTVLFFDFGRAPHLPILGWQESLASKKVVDSGDSIFQPLRLAWEAGLENSLSREDSLQRLRS